MASPIIEVGSQFISKIFGGILIFGLVAIVVGVLIGLIWYFVIYKKKFNISVKVISERAEDKCNLFFDKAAILKSRKTGETYLRLWETKVELLAPKYNIFQVTDKGDYFELYRTAEGMFYYLTPSKISKKYIIRTDGKVHLMANQTNISIDQDMEFWKAKRKTANKGMFSTESVWMKLLPYIPAILGGMITIFILYILMSHLPAILSQLTELAKTLNEQSRAIVTTG